MKRMSYSKSNKSQIRDSRKAKEMVKYFGSIAPEAVREYEKKKNK